MAELVGIQGRELVTWWAAKRVGKLVELSYYGFGTTVHDPVTLYFTPEEWKEVCRLVDETFDTGSGAGS